VVTYKQMVKALTAERFGVSYFKTPEKPKPMTEAEIFEVVAENYGSRKRRNADPGARRRPDAEQQPTQ
jgi:hypothetical protein